MIDPWSMHNLSWKTLTADNASPLTRIAWQILPIGRRIFLDISISRYLQPRSGPPWYDNRPSPHWMRCGLRLWRVIPNIALRGAEISESQQRCASFSCSCVRSMSAQEESYRGLHPYSKLPRFTHVLSVPVMWCRGVGANLSRALPSPGRPPQPPDSNSSPFLPQSRLKDGAVSW
jgi:hypothetical protein